MTWATIKRHRRFLISRITYFISDLSACMKKSPSGEPYNAKFQNAGYQTTNQHKMKNQPSEFFCQKICSWRLRGRQNVRRSWFLELDPRSLPALGARSRLWGLAPGSLPALGPRSWPWGLAPSFEASLPARSSLAPAFWASLPAFRATLPPCSRLGSVFLSSFQPRSPC